MPAPGRKQVAYDDIEYRALTMKIDASIIFNPLLADGSAQVGLAVMLVADDTVGLATDGSQVFGKVLYVTADNFANIQVDGMCTLPSGTAAAITRASAIVGALNGGAAGYIRAVNTAVPAELGRAKGNIVANADPANVWVELR
jgi:hypothetical protein